MNSRWQTTSSEAAILTCCERAVVTWPCKSWWNYFPREIVILFSYHVTDSSESWHSIITRYIIMYYIIPVYWWWKSRDLIGLDIELARLKRVIMHCWYDNALLARVQILFVYERWVVVRRDTDSELFELSEEDFLSMRQYFMRNYEGNFESNPVIAYLFKPSPTTCTKVKAL